MVWMSDGLRVSLSERMAAAARELQDQVDSQATMLSAVNLAVANVDGCDFAGISIVHARRHIDTPAATDGSARTADRLQYELGEGPCLDAIWEQQTIYSPRLSDDPRWPSWGPRVAEKTGARSVLAFQLFTTGNTLGALNLFSRTEDGFADDDRNDGLALAAHVAIAVAAAQEIQSLSSAMDSRSLIGQALGIVMERYKIDVAHAFAVLTRVSQAGNVKLRDVAEELVTTRVLAAEGSARNGATGRP